MGTETDLIGYWNFEEGSGNIVYDQTNNGNDGNNQWFNIQYKCYSSIL